MATPATSLLAERLADWTARTSRALPAPVAAPVAAPARAPARAPSPARAPALALARAADPANLVFCLHRALQARQGLGRLPDTDVCRLLDGEGIPRFVDLYGDQLVLQSYVDFDPRDATGVEQHLLDLQAEAQLLGHLLQPRAVWIKLRPPQTNELIDPARLAPDQPAFGEGPGTSLVREHGMALTVRLDDGLATGLYLDQRDNRLWLRNHARGLRVLNTFCYTAAFSVAAALGGAARTVSLDAAAPALRWAEENLNLHGLGDRTVHDLLRGDALQWLPKMHKRGDQFDVVIVDPPSHSTVKGKRWSALQHYRDLAAMACAVLAPGGRLLACINATSVDGERLAQWLRQGAAQAGRTVRDLHTRKTQADFPSGRMKSVLATVV